MKFFRGILKFIDRILSFISIVLIRIYQLTLSPDKGLLSPLLKGKVCTHTPHCSQYALESIKNYGFIRSYVNIMDRVAECTPSNEKKYDPPCFRVVFFCSSPIGVNFMEKLHEDERFKVVGAVTSPDKPAGRGMQIKENIIKQKAKKLGIQDITTPEKINPQTSQEGKEFHERLCSRKPDFSVVISYGKIIPEEILNTAQIASINIHGSLLPKYRGSSPLQYALLHGEETTGITLIKMNTQLDAGDIIKKQEFKIPFHRTVKEVIEKMTSSGPDFLNQTLRDFGKGFITPLPQNEEEVSFSYKISKKDGEIDIYKTPLEDIYSRYRAYYLRPGIFFLMDENFGENKGKNVKIEKLIIDKEKYENNKKNPLIKDNKLNLNDAVEEIKVKPEGKKQIDREKFLRGYKK